MSKNLFPVVKESFVYIATSIVVLLFCLVFDFEFLTFIDSVVLLFLLYAFRNPERAIPEFSDKSLLSLSDGVVNSIEDIEDDEYAYKIEVEGNYLNVALLRTPFNASVVSIKHIHGTRVSKKSHLYADLNEKIEIVFEDLNSNKIKVIHRAKQSFSPISCDLNRGEKSRQTFRYGVMLNGVTTLYLPHNFRVNVKVGNELKASESLMGYFS